MAKVATDVLKIGFTPAALPGNVVSDEAIKKYGWEDKVKEAPKPKTAKSKTTKTKHTDEDDDES